MTRIKDIGTTTTSAASDDYVALDGTTNASRKILASNIVGGLVFIERQTFTTASEVDIDLPDAYDSFRIEMVYSLLSSSDLALRISDDGFSTVESGASDYSYSFKRYAGTFGGGEDDLHDRILTAGFNRTSTNSIMTLEVVHAKETGAPTRINFAGDYLSGTDSGSVHGVGTYLTSSSINGLRAFPTAGNITGLYRS